MAAKKTIIKKKDLDFIESYIEKELITGKIRRVIFPNDLVASSEGKILGDLIVCGSLTVGGGSVGEANTGANVGTSTGNVFKNKTGVTLNFKTLGGSNLGAGAGNVFKDITDGTNDITFNYKTLIGGTNITITDNTNDITIDATTAGEANTGANVGAGTGNVFRDKTGVTLNFKTLIGGTNVTVTDNADDITIDAATSGEANTASNLGGGQGIFSTKVGVDLRFKSLVAGSAINFSSDANEITVNAEAADPGASYVTLNTTASLPNERALTAGTGIILTDAGAGSSITVGINDGVVATVSGTTFTGDILAPVVSATLGFSGSLTRLLDGRSYLAAGSNVTITSESNGQITIASTGGGGSDVDWTDAGDALHTTSSVAIGTGSVASVQGTDVLFFVSGAKDGRDTISGSTALFGGDVVFSGSLGFGSSSISIEWRVISGTGVSVIDFVGTSGSLFSLNDSFTGTLGSINDASGLPVFEVFSDNRVIMGEFGQDDFHMSGNMVGIGVQPTHKFHVSGSSTDSSLFEQTISGSIHQTQDGLSYLVGAGTVSVLSQSNGQIIISGTGDGGGGGGANTLDEAYDGGGAGAGRAITVDAGAVQMQGSIGSNVLEATGSVDITGSLTVDNGAAVGGSISGSIHHTADGLSYLVGTGTVTVLSQSNGQIVISGTGDGGGGAGNTLDQAYDQGGAGVGRQVTVDAGAVQLQGTVGTNVLEATGSVAITGSLHVSGANGGPISGSITRTGNGVSYLVAVGGISITSQSNGQIEISGSGVGGAGVTLDSAYDGGRTVTVDAGAVQFQGTIGTNVFEVTGTVDVTGSLTVDNGADPGGSISGSIHHTSDGLSYLVGDGTVSIISQSNGQIIISGTGDGGGGGGGNTLDQAYDQGGAGAGRQVTVDTGAVQLQGTVGTNSLEVTGTVDIDGHLAATTKSFEIKHPSKEGKLRHGVLEGPEHAVFVRGEGWGPVIELPDYWIDLVDEDTITVQLTPIEYHQELSVTSWNAREIKVRSERGPTAHYFYTVCATRKDVPKLKVEE